MRLTDEMITEDDKRFVRQDMLNEFKYCGKEVPLRKSITNDDIRFYAWLCRSAYALLKEHEHGETFTVIDTKTGKEADEYEIALHEDWARDLCYCDMEGWAIENDGTLLLVDECGKFAYADRERFKVVWN